jgi:hypothetical protein
MKKTAGRKKDSAKKWHILRCHESDFLLSLPSGALLYTTFSIPVLDTLIRMA